MSDPVSWLWWGVQGVWVHLKEISILLGGIASVAGYYFYHWTAELADPAALEKLRPSLNDSPWRISYRHTLDRALEAADRFFGPPVSWRAFGVCLTIATFYPLLLFVLTWGLSGLNTSVLTAMLPNGESFVGRIVTLTILGLAIIAISMDIRNKGGGFARIGSTLIQISPSWIWKREISWTGLVLFTGAATYLNTGSISLALSAAVIIVITLALYLAEIRDERSAALVYATLFAGCTTVGLVATRVKPTTIPTGFLYVFTFIYSFVAALLGAVHVAGAAAIIGAGGVTLVSATMEYLAAGEAKAFGPLDMSYFTFFFMLPFLNSLIDAVSWAVSRWLGREMLDRNFHRWGMIGFALLDFVIALILLSVLAALFGAGVELLDRLAVTAKVTSILDVDAMIAQATMEPFGNGLWITLMLFSTLAACCV
jgi:hypothetical protein